MSPIELQAKATFSEASLSPYRKRLLWCSSHEVERRMGIVMDCFRHLGDESGWRLMSEEWEDW